MLGTGTPHNRTVKDSHIRQCNNRAITQGRWHVLLHLLRDLLVDRVTEVFHCALPAPEYDWGVIVWRQPARLSVYADEVERLPHHLDELVDVPPFARGNRDAVRDAVE